MCYLPPSTECARPLEVQVPSMAGINIPTLKLYRTKIYPTPSFKNAWPESRMQPMPSDIDVKANTPHLSTSTAAVHHTHPLPLDLPDDIFCPPPAPDSETFMSPLLSTTQSSECASPSVSDSLPFSSPAVTLSRRPKMLSNLTIEPPTLYTMPPVPSSPTMQDDEIPDHFDEATELEHEINPEDAWNLVPYHISWGSIYHGYKAGTLPGPDGKCIFLRSPTPLKNQRTGQACEKCRERKAKCSGTRPSCARCVARGHECEYGPEIKRPRASDLLEDEDEDSHAIASGSSSAVQSRQSSSLPPSQVERTRTVANRARSSTESLRSKLSNMPSGSASRRRNTVMASPSKKRRTSVRDREEADQPYASPQFDGSPSSLGLLPTISGSTDGDTEEHDTLSTSSDSSETESHQSFSFIGQSGSLGAVYQDSYPPSLAPGELLQLRFSEQPGDLSYSHLNSGPSDLYSRIDIDARMADSFTFDYPIKPSYSPVTNQHATPSIPYQHCLPSSVERALTFSLDGYPTHPIVDGDDGGEVELDLTTFSAAVTSSIDSWRPTSNVITTSGFSFNREPRVDFMYVQPSGSSELSTYMAAEQALDPAALAYLESLETLDIPPGYGYRDADTLNWRPTSELVPMSMMSDSIGRPLVRGPGVYFDRHGGLDI